MTVAQDPRRRMRTHLLLVLGLIALCWAAGCGGDTSTPAQVDAAQAKKVQQALGRGYRDQLIAEAKKQAEAKKAAEKKSP
jgi:hypothetical protein